MTKFFKRAAAGALALAICAGLTGCYSENNAWAAKMGDDTMPIGGYIYYLSSAYSEAAGKVGSEQEVLKADIDGKSASQWVEDRAMDYLYSYYYVENKFNELGLELTEEEQASVDSTESYMWSVYGKTFESMGIAENSFKQAYAEYNTKLGMILEATYGKGGEMEIPEDELHQYYTGDYMYYQYMYADLTTTDEEGNAQDMDDDEKAEVKEYLEDQAELVNKGELDLDTAASNYATLHETEPNTSGPLSYRREDMSDLFAEALEPLENGEAIVLETGTRYYILQRMDVEEDFKALIADESRTGSLLREMKSEEFAQYTIDQGRSMDVQINSGAIGTVKISKIADVMGKNGVSSASEESGESSEESSSESSEESESESSEESESESSAE